MKVLITIAVCSLIGFWCWNHEKQNIVKAQNTQNITKVVQAPARPFYSPAFNELSEYANIDKTLRIVAEKWKSSDINGDGKNNCIDAALLFYQYYPDKSKVCIESNHNSDTNFHHLFNCVFTDGVWKAIEPQSYTTNHSNYLMWAVWGNQYDNTYNRDVTPEFIKYVKK